MGGNAFVFATQRQSDRSSFLIGAGNAAASASSRVSQTNPGDSARDGHDRTATRCGRIVSRKCVKPCSMGAKRGAGDDARTEARMAMCGDLGVDIDFGQAPQPAPRCRSRAASRAGSSPARSMTSTRTARCGRRLLRARRRQFVDAPVAQRNAVDRDRTFAAARPGSRADGRAQIHQRLRVRGHVARGQQRFGDAPEFRLDLRRAGKAVDAAMAGEHALDVAVENRRALTERERGDRRRGRAPDARQRRDGVERLAETFHPALPTMAFAAACRWCARR